jgi:hypothetical protein
MQVSLFIIAHRWEKIGAFEHRGTLMTFQWIDID